MIEIKPPNEIHCQRVYNGYGLLIFSIETSNATDPHQVQLSNMNMYSLLLMEKSTVKFRLHSYTIDNSDGFNEYKDVKKCLFALCIQDINYAYRTYCKVHNKQKMATELFIPFPDEQEEEYSLITMVKEQDETIRRLINKIGNDDISCVFEGIRNKIRAIKRTDIVEVRNYTDIFSSNINFT
jgi:hypothetical protein